MSCVPPLTQSVEHSEVQPFLDDVIAKRLLVMGQRDYVKLDERSRLDFLRIGNSNSLALHGLRPERSLAAADLAIVLNRNEAVGSVIGI